MANPAVHVRSLRKVFDVPVREAGLRQSLSSLVHRRTKEVVAVDGIDLDVAAGEMIGFLGPNGAGKTTTLKMLSGLLHPTAGEVAVLGYEPRRRRPDFLRRISLVMGNRNQLQWDLPALDSFELHRAVYGIPRADFVARRDELVDLLGVGDLVTKPVRNLSLGERMKMEFADALLHRPDVLFLDEPTIGLDVTAQRRIREFVGEFNRRHGSTVMLTSHYMADVQALCKRVVVIDHGRILFDGGLTALTERFATHKTIGVRPAEAAETRPETFAEYGETGPGDDGQVLVRVPRAEATRVAARILAEHDIADLTIEDVPIESVIEQAFGAERDDTDAASV